MQQKENKQQEEFINPIDEDKIAQTRTSLPYAHTVGRADQTDGQRGKAKGRGGNGYVQTNRYAAFTRSKKADRTVGPTGKSHSAPHLHIRADLRQR